MAILAGTRASNYRLNDQFTGTEDDRKLIIQLSLFHK